MRSPATPGFSGIQAHSSRSTTTQLSARRSPQCSAPRPAPPPCLTPTLPTPPTPSRGCTRRSPRWTSPHTQTGAKRCRPPCRCLRRTRLHTTATTLIGPRCTSEEGTRHYTGGGDAGGGSSEHGARRRVQHEPYHGARRWRRRRRWWARLRRVPHVGVADEREGQREDGRAGVADVAAGGAGGEGAERETMVGGAT